MENNFIDMKKNIASSEFNQKFQIFVPKDRERDSMKMLSPTTQIVLVKSSAFERISAVHIYSDHICGVMEPQLVRPERCVGMLTNTNCCEARFQRWKNIVRITAQDSGRSLEDV